MPEQKANIGLRYAVRLQDLRNGHILTAVCGLQERIHAARILPLYQSLLQSNRPTSANPARAPSGAHRPPSIPVARLPQADLFDLG